jgi:hypothetical protein
MSIERLDVELQLRPAWRREDSRVAADAKAFWKRLNLLSPQEIDRRISELCSAAYHDGELVSVSTAVPQPFESLKSRFALFRCAVDPRYPREHVAVRMAAFSYTQLEHWAHENPNEEVAGMLVPIPVQDMRQRQSEPVWRLPGIELYLVGYTPTGEQIRVSWFSRGRLN